MNFSENVKYGKIVIVIFTIVVIVALVILFDRDFLEKNNNKERIDRSSAVESSEKVFLVSPTSIETQILITTTPSAFPLISTPTLQGAITATDKQSLVEAKKTPINSRVRSVEPVPKSTNLFPSPSATFLPVHATNMPTLAPKTSTPTIIIREVTQLPPTKTPVRRPPTRPS